MSAPSSATVDCDFSAPPKAPMGLARAWLSDARASKAKAPGVLALATVDANRHAFNRIVQVLDVRDTGLVFTTHAGSAKGRQLAQNSWASGVMYWPETDRQLIVSGPTRPLPDRESDAFWAARPLGPRPMSAVSKQSEPLLCEHTLREQAAALSSSASSLPRPPAFLAYQIEPEVVEFWQADPARLHKRLRYQYTGDGWRTERLQP